MKKLLLSLGTLSTVAAPIISVVSCGSQKQIKEQKGPLENTKETQGVLEENKRGVDTENEESKIAKATPEELANNLMYQGKTMKYYDVITKINGDGTFEITTAYYLEDHLMHYTNKLVKTNAGQHDLTLNPDFDISSLRIGTVISEDKIDGVPFVATSISNGKTFKYFVIKGAKLVSGASRGPKPSVATQQSIPSITDTTTQGPTSDTEETKNNPFSGGVKTVQTITDLKAAFPEYYKDLDENISGEKLFEELRAIQSSHLEGVGSYGDLWNTYKDAFIDKYQEKDNTILDIYSENPTGVDKYEFKPGDDQDHGRHSRESDSYNREHMIPQSIFGKNAAHIHNDAHFIFPTDAVVNEKRSNYPYGEVTSIKEQFSQGDKLGTNKNGVEVFEPIDAFKGDVARATLYFVLTWKGTSWDQQLAQFAPFGGTAIGGIKQEYLSIYLNWSHKDAISQFDVDRNNAIAKDENGIRNPFVDMPKLVDLIWGENQRKVNNPKSGVKTPATPIASTQTPIASTQTPVLGGISMDEALAKPMISTKISAKHLPGIKADWDTISKILDKDKLVDRVQTDAYGNADSESIKNNVKDWLDRVLASI